MIREKHLIDNRGQNSGVIVEKNEGTIILNSQNAVKVPSLISGLIKILGNVCIEEELSNEVIDTQEFKPDDKIQYNAVIMHREIIEEFSVYYSTCEKYLNAYDNSHIRGKAKILKCIHMWYLRAKGQVLLENSESGKSEMEIVRDNSDKIIDMVEEKILQVMKESGEIESACQEEVELGIACFTCYCFMECKILEKPL